MRRALIPALVSAALFAVVGLTAASAAPADGPLFAVLLGENEIPAGDPDGRGAANVIIHQGEQLCFGLSVTGIGDPTAAHIHRGGKHEVGGVVVPLSPPSTGDPGASAACVPIGADLAAEILAKPHDFYVNVHNAAFPGGALRGQLFRDTH